jgi:hypothetical protein
MRRSCDGADGGAGNRLPGVRLSAPAVREPRSPRALSQPSVSRPPYGFGCGAAITPRAARSIADQPPPPLVDEDVGDDGRARRPRLAARCAIPGRQLVDFVPAHRRSEQRLQFLLPFGERLLRRHRPSFSNSRGSPGNGASCPQRRGSALGRKERAGDGCGPVKAVSQVPLLAVADLGPHPAFLASHLAPPFAFPHPIKRPFGNEWVLHREV